jgi:hypothetical protein
VRIMLWGIHTRCRDNRILQVGIEDVQTSAFRNRCRCAAHGFDQIDARLPQR